jgi:hypothetical protein
MVHPPHPITKLYSLTHLPVASMWVIASTTSYLYLLPLNYLLLRGSGYFSSQTFSCTIPHFLNHSEISYLLAYEDGTDRVLRNVGI